MNSKQPFTGGYYSPYETGDFHIKKCVKEDEMFWYFHDKVKYSKDLPFSWFQREKPECKTNKSEPFIFPYESYSLWSRQLAQHHTLAELKKVVSQCELLSNTYAKQHLSAIQATTSMQSQSQRRSQARNNVSENYEKKMAYKNAIELYQYYPEKCKH